MLKSARTLVTTVVVATAALIGLTACGGGGSAGKPATVSSIPASPEAGQFKMGIEPWLGYGPWWIADNQKMFGAHGLDVAITNFTQDADINSALASGKLDGANIATHTAMNMIQSGLPVTAVLLLDQSEKADAIMADKSITSVKQLKGQSVAYEEGTTSNILLSYALKQNGLSLDDIKKVPMPAANVGAALLAGKVKVGVTYEPYLSTIAKKPGYHYLYTAAEKPGIVSDVFVVRNDVLKQRPGQVLALLKTWKDASQYLRANKAAGQKVIAAKVGDTPANLASAFNGVKIYTLAESKQLMTGDFASSTVPAVAAAAKDAGILKGDIGADQFLNTSFVDAAG